MGLENIFFGVENNEGKKLFVDYSLFTLGKNQLTLEEAQNVKLGQRLVYNGFLDNGYDKILTPGVGYKIISMRVSLSKSEDVKAGPMAAPDEYSSQLVDSAEALEQQTAKGNVQDIEFSEEKDKYVFTGLLINGLGDDVISAGYSPETKMLTFKFISREDGDTIVDEYDLLGRIRQPVSNVAVENVNNVLSVSMLKKL